MSTLRTVLRRLTTFFRTTAALVMLVGAPLPTNADNDARATAAAVAQAAASAASSAASAAAASVGAEISASRAASAAASATSAAADAAAKRDLAKKLDENTRFDVQCEYVVSNSMRQKLTDAFDTFWLRRETLYPDPTICPPAATQEREKDGSLTTKEAEAASAAEVASAAEAKGTPSTPSHQFKTSRAERVMHGPGEVVIVVKDEDYVAALKDATEDKPLHLFLNGFDMGTDGDGSLVGVVRNGGLAALLFHAGASGKTSQAFWTDLYHQHGILAYVPLRASIGWGTQPRFVPGANLKGDPMYVSVSDPTSFVLATLFGGALILFFAWALRNSDTFRVAPLYPWWLDARTLQTQIHKAVVPLIWWWPFKRKKFNVTAAMGKSDSLLKIAEFVYGKYKDISLSLQAELPVVVPPVPTPVPVPVQVPEPPVDPTNPLAVAAAEAANAATATAAALAAQAALDAQARIQARIATAGAAVKLVATARAALDADEDLKQKTTDESATPDGKGAVNEAEKLREGRLADFGKALGSFSSGWDSFRGGGATPTTSAETFAAVVGLALFGGKVRPLRLPYSLVRVQWGAWMMFATAAAVYLWLVYGEFPALDGSVLGLVTVSTLTAGGSFIVDSQIGNSTGYSRGFVFDLMTGANDVQQAHRYQALVVNVLLFAVGIVYVSQHLAYPVFDASWLGLMTLSGIAQTAGKGILEAPPDKADSASKKAVGG